MVLASCDNDVDFLELLREFGEHAHDACCLLSDQLCMEAEQYSKKVQDARRATGEYNMSVDMVQSRKLERGISTIADLLLGTTPHQHRNRICMSCHRTPGKSFLDNDRHSRSSISTEDTLVGVSTEGAIPGRALNRLSA